MRRMTGLWYNRVQHVLHTPHVRQEPKHIGAALLCTLVLESYLVHHATDDWPTSTREAVLTSVCLVQCGLHAHEAMDRCADERGRRVLIGDFLSAQYYFLLASCGFIEAIAVIADAICVYTTEKQRAWEQARATHAIAGERAVFVAWERWIEADAFVQFAQTIDAIIERASDTDDDVWTLYARCPFLTTGVLGHGICAILAQWAAAGDTIALKS